MIVIILAAGKGKRMQPLTETRLKGSLPIQNQPLLLKLAEMLEQLGILDKLILVISPSQEKAMRELFSIKPYTQKVELAIQDPPMGTGDALRKAEPFIGKEKHCLVLNGDILACLDKVIPKLIKQHNKLKALCTLVVYPGKSDRYAQIQLTAEGRVLEIKEKIKMELINEKNSYINAGIYLFNREIFDILKAIPLSERGEYELPDAITLLGKKGPIGGITIDAWMSIENPLDLFRAQEFYPPAGKMLSMQFHTGEEIGFKAVEDIYIEKDAEIKLSGITFVGPTLIGKGTLIGIGSHIGPKAFFGFDCEIGENVSIKNSLVMDNCKIGNNSKVNNLIAAEEIVIGQKVEIAPMVETKTKEEYKDEFVIVGGRTVIASNVVLKKEMLIKAHSTIQAKK